MFLTCAPASTATGFAIVSINFMGAGGIEVWMGSISPSLIFQPHSSDTSLLAQPFQS